MAGASIQRTVSVFPSHDSTGLVLNGPGRYIDALHWTMDGNFKLNQRKKPMDQDDFALTEGTGYFAHAREYAAFVRKLPPTG